MVDDRSHLTKRVLIADDDPIIRRLLSSAVTSAGYTAVVVDDGRAAFRMLQSDAAFAAALFDMRMPGLNGIDLIRHMRTEKRLQRIPVLLITAEQDLKVMSDGFAAGAVAFLSKPLTVDKLQTALSMLLPSAQTHIAA
ncbi:MAG: two-component system, chemotaxis family, chemotaxis protein CheY [Pyrinomonadaceae bacterium]|jgi:CheY-like chemotaxis protein|nr:two-component system, chemotaxis family, chemotaxis protein CheY [Pyrinomonadaceae bacterium]